MIRYVDDELFTTYDSILKGYEKEIGKTLDKMKEEPERDNLLSRLEEQILNNYNL